MEAAPRLPMLSFDLKVCSENTQFAPQLKQYIATFYHEDPDAYHAEIQNLEALRALAVRPSMDADGVKYLKKYYCQLHFLKSRFPMEEGQEAAVQFSWKDTQLYASYSCSDIQFELMAIMYNIGALHSYLGANDSRSNPDGLKMACTNFQWAAWAFQTVKEKYHQYIMYISTIEIVHFLQQVSLAQAQECILEKSMLDNRKASIVAKVAVQVYNYYRQSLVILESASEDLYKEKTYKEWTKYLQFKICYYKCISLLFQGQQAEEQQKMGERVAFYQAACEQLEEARKWSGALKNRQQDIQESLAFTSDVVEGKRKAAKNENEFIYHEEVPDKDHLVEVKGASLVKGIPFSVNDIEVSGPDIFARLVPMEAHEAASLYSEKKAQMLRQMGELIETKDQALAEFLSSLQLDLFTKMRQATGIPQELIDRAAALSVKPNITKDLIATMGKLSDIYQEVESGLNEIDQLLKEEEEAEKGYQEIMGSRPPSIIATDLAREAAKYREAHTKANDSNQTLHRAMTAHVANLKLIQQPLRQLQHHLPSIELPNANIDENSLKTLETLTTKVEEMRNQRAMLWAQLRESVHKDDITNSLITRSPSQSTDQLFQQELQKHQQLTGLIEQNTEAQENIKKALVDAYAQAVNTRRYIQDVINKRQTTITALITSADSYNDLLAKANKGIEFYTKLETNVSKLLQRIKSTCKVQQEEREQMLSKNDFPKPEVAASTAPKLRDYLELRKNPSNVASYADPKLQYQPQNVNYGIDSNIELHPGIRPAPLGSEVTDLPQSGHLDPQGYPKSAHYGTTANDPKQNDDQDLANKMNAAFSNSKFNPNVPQYSHSNYVPQNYVPVSYPQSSQANTSDTQYSLNAPYDPSKAYTSTTNSYRPLPSCTVPNNTSTHMQYPDSSLGNPVAAMNTHFGAQYPAAGYSQSAQHNVNSYYPQGYAPNYSASSENAAQTFPAGQVQYHSVEYATSVQPNQSNLNYNSTYSSPMSDLQRRLSVTNDTSHFDMVPASTHNLSSYPANASTQSYQNFHSYPTSSAVSSFPTSSAAYTSYPSGSATSYPTVSNTYPTNSGSYAAGSSSYSAGSGSYPAGSNVDRAGSGSYPAGSNVDPAGSGSYPSGSGSYPAGSFQTDSGAYQPGTGTYPAGSGSYPVGSFQAGSDSFPAGSSSYLSGYYPAESGSYPAESYPISSTSYPYAAPANSDPQSMSNFTPSYPQSYSGIQGAQQDYPNVYYAAGRPDQSFSPSQPYQAAGSGTMVTGQNSSEAGYASPGTYYEQAVPVVTKESNIDLLSGLDFTISQAPLVPQQNIAQQQEAKPSSSETKANVSKPVAVVSEDASAPLKPKRPVVKILPSKPLNNKDVKDLFKLEVDKYEKYVETLTIKTLSGPTTLDIKWKEIQDKQDCDVQKKIISVARCYPMKNRFSDILPYDHSRVELCGAKDDYINASYIKDISPYAPPIIVTQAPLHSTADDFWTMVREQQVELIFCLLNDEELGEDVYWPREKGRNVSFLNMVLSCQSVIVKSHWTETLISINMPEKRDSWAVMHLQFTSWPGSLFPTCPDPFVSYVVELINLYQQQRCNTHPVVVHCSSGIGRSGLVCLLTAAIFDVTNNANSVPDLATLTSKLTNCRKNILRDREHLKFAYECFLAYMMQVVSQDKSKRKLNELTPKIKEEAKPTVEVVEKNTDPLSTLDPFWASKK